jgi:hypothetical protein
MMHNNVLWEIISPAKENLVWPSSNLINSVQEQKNIILLWSFYTHNLAQHIIITGKTLRIFSDPLSIVVN